MVKVFKNSSYSVNKNLSSTTLIISFYKNTRMLNLVLASVQKQTFKDFNLIICDDGSPEEIVSDVQNALQNLTIPSLHLWHEDLGFRKNRILNWGLHHAQSEHVVFIDQDCILHPEFMAEHYFGREKNSVLCGRRINFTSWVSRLLTPLKVSSGYIEKNIYWIMLSGLFMKDNNSIKGIYFKNSKLRKWANKKNRGIVGCNFSLFRQHLLDINGFDTRYEGAGFGEDSDIEFRLTLNRITMKPACNTAIQYHVYHRLLNRESANEVLYNSVLKEKQSRTKFGLTEQTLEN